MKISKRFLCCLLVFCILLALTACADKTNDTQTVEVPEVAADGSADANIWKAYQLGLIHKNILFGYSSLLQCNHLPFFILVGAGYPNNNRKYSYTFLRSSVKL